MIFKLCFAQQIHRSPKVPDSYESLVGIVKQTFKDALPEKFNMSYVDQEGDRVILQAEDDFKSMTESISQQANKTVKIFITAEGQDEIPEDMMNSRIAISKSDILDQFQVLLNKKDGNGERVEDKIKEVPNLLEDLNEEVKIEDPKPVEPVIEVSTILIDKQPVEVKEPELVEKKEPELVEQKEEKLVVEEQKPVEEEKPKEEEKPVEVLIKHEELVVLENRDEIQVSKAKVVEDDDRIDLTDKKALREFILLTIEEAMPQIMANYFSNKSIDEKKGKDGNAVVRGIKDVASHITSKVEKIVIGEKEGLSARITKVEKIIPEVITTSDEQVYVTVVVKNNGTEPFPVNSFLQNTGGLFGDIIRVPPLEARKEFKTTIIINGSKKPGNFGSKWRFGYIDQRNVTKYLGEEMEVRLAIIEKKYSKEVQDKARTLKELIPDPDISVFLEFVSQDAKKPIEVLIEEFLLNHSSK